MLEQRWLWEHIQDKGDDSEEVGSSALEVSGICVGSTIKIEKKLKLMWNAVLEPKKMCWFQKSQVQW